MIPRGRSIRPAMAVAFAMAVAVAACEKPQFEPPDRAARIAAADEIFSMALFDSIAWPSDSIRALEGNVVYSTYCRNCHGALGRGETDYDARRGLEVPSLVAPAWQYAEARDSVLHRVFVGHVQGMPTWGVAGISPREMDAVTHYLMDVLRPEVAAMPAGDGG
ncbi:MAG: cytochrome c [Gemmatimonadetes bacterium]|nr:cytochrome c [Gemmatimonadota bacterium]NNF38169.1 cytochrome c [Gemmatimonadota bacterium]